MTRDAGVAAPAAHVLVAVALAAGLLAVDVAVVDAVRVAVAALAADERVVAVGLGLPPHIVEHLEIKTTLVSLPHFLKGHYF